MGHMHDAEYSNFDSGSRAEVLQMVNDSYSALADHQDNWVANLANCSSLLWHAYNEGLKVPVNWCGFYVVDPKNDDQLILGPFMGKVACQTIKIGNGVCGTAANTKVIQRVPDVTKFPGHIACDGDTKSEIVVPIIQDNVLKGVLDMDCLENNGFHQEDIRYLENLSDSIARSCQF
ncbi:DEBR0S2_15830g1_1 [Brettanomyces bruxellensis]|uniref:DEBR0S2_15830g1_1 n=1 Tax=Dekkera bruxellensis TaxID=5007 RepID=A0A7D9H1J4_DEKBR|nr:DEBR0S2_15830g1_1 [Brettanomyces bruxellensis]